MADEYERQLASTGIDRHALNAFIAGESSRLPYIDALRATDSECVIGFGEDILPGSKESVADRDYFIKLRDDPNAGIVISASQPGLGNKEVVFARRLNQAKEVFAGIVFSVITAEHFATLISQLDIGQKGFISLRDGHLNVIVRYPNPTGFPKVTN